MTTTKVKAENRATRSTRRLRKAALFEQLGPGLITGAADDDPSGIATYSQAGAQFGFNMLWTMVLTYPLMTAVQLVSAQIGRVTGCGLASNLGAVLPKPFVLALVALLFVANTINIGADLARYGRCHAARRRRPGATFTLGLLCFSLTLQLFIPYSRYANYLKWLTLVLLTYIAVISTVQINWLDVAKGLLLADLSTHCGQLYRHRRSPRHNHHPYCSSGRAVRKSRSSTRRPAQGPSSKRQRRRPASSRGSRSTHLRAWRFLTLSLWRS